MTATWRRCAVLCVLAGGWPLQAAAADGQQVNSAPMSIDELMKVDVQRVVGASKFQQEVVDAPSAVSIVTHEEIDTYGYRTLADILRSVRGFYVSSDRNYSYLGVRGFLRPGDYNTRVLLLVDGHRLNDNVFDEAMIGTEFPLDVELIDRVEVVRGPNSSLYGDNAFFAVVNIITRRSTSLGTASGSLDAGSLGTARGRATITHSWGQGREAVFSMSGYRSHGASTLFYPELAGEPGGGVARDMDTDRARSVFGSFVAGHWTGVAMWSLRRKQIPTGAYDTALDDPRSMTRDRRSFADLRYDGVYRGVTTTVRAAYDRYDYDGDYASAQPDGGPDPDLLSDYSRGEWWTVEASGNKRVHRAHVLSAGAEVRYDQRQDQGIVYQVEGQTFDDRRRTGHWGAYVQDEFHVSRRVLVNGGLRFDYYPSFGGTVNPRGALIFRPQAGQSLKVLFGQAFRAPNAYERYYYGDVALAPERINTTELVWEQYLAGPLRLSASVFHYGVSDLITEVAVSDAELGYSFVNGGRSAATGLGLELETSLAQALHVAGGYTYARAQLDGVDPSNSPRHLANVRIAVPIAGRHGIAALDSNVISSRLTLGGQNLPAVALLNATVSDIHVAPGTLLAIDVKNLFDRRYADPGSAEHRQSAIPQDGRTIRARLTWGF